MDRLSLQFVLSFTVIFSSGLRVYELLYMPIHRLTQSFVNLQFRTWKFVNVLMEFREKFDYVRGQSVFCRARCQAEILTICLKGFWSRAPQNQRQISPWTVSRILLAQM